MRKKRIYAIYKGEDFLFEGTAKECAEHFKVKKETVWFWNSEVNKRRNKKVRKIAIVIEEEGNE